MSAESLAQTPQFDLRTVRVLRYATGAALAMAVAMGIDWQLSYLLPVLSLSFLASPDPCPTLKQGVSFVAVIIVASVVGLLLSRWFLAYPMVYVPFMALVLFRIFYAKAGGRSPLLTMWLLIAVLLIPLVSMLAPEVAIFVAIAIAGGAAATVALVWVTYFFFPDPVMGPGEAAASKPAAASPPTASERLRSALETTAVVLPVFVLFYTLQWASSLLILVFIAILSSQPGFAQNYKAGVGLILGNVLGGLVSIVLYEVLVLVPSYPFMVLLTLLVGLLMGNQLFAGKKLSPLFGMGFSTVLLVIGSTTSGNNEADSKVISRVVQIMIAVIYVVVSFGLLARWRRRRGGADG